MTKSKVLTALVIGILIGLVIAQAREINNLKQVYPDINRAIRAGGIK